MGERKTAKRLHLDQRPVQNLHLQNRLAQDYRLKLKHNLRFPRRFFLHPCDPPLTSVLAIRRGGEATPNLLSHSPPSSILHPSSSSFTLHPFILPLFSLILPP